MRRSLALALASAAMLAASPAFATGDPLGGIQALHDYNLIVLNDFTTGHDVEGRVLVGNDVTGNASQFGIGSSHAGQGSTASSNLPILTVGRNVSAGDIKIENGTNGAAATKIGVNTSYAIAGNSTKMLLNGGTPRSGIVAGDLSGGVQAGAGVSIMVGHNLSGGIDGNVGGSVLVGNSISGSVNANGAAITSGLGSAFATSLKTPITSVVTQAKEDVQALAGALAALTLGSNPSTADFMSGVLTLNAVDGGNGFALFNLNASAFTGLTSLAYNFPSTTLPVFVNIFGTSNTANPADGVVMGFNSISGASANQQVIFNFVDALKVDFTGNLFHGSVLATKATLYSHTPIEGSVVANNFIQGGEVHLGTYNLGLPTPPVTPAVPEPATWAMMIGGFALAGAGLRRRSTSAVRFNAA